MTDDIVLRVVESGAGPICRTILESVPEWFGIPEANDDYVAQADRTPTTVASIDGRDVGLLNLVHHSPYAAEVHLMAVVREHHRRGIGRRLLEHAERQLAWAGVEFLQVKTLSPSRKDPNYERTRAFYLAYGFRVLEEFPTLWDPSNPALQLVKTISRPGNPVD